MSDSNVDRALELMGRDEYAKLTGLEVVEVAPGSALVRMLVSKKILNGRGVVHGGAYFTLADFAAAVAANSCGVAAIGTDCSISYLRATSSGCLFARARTVKNGRNLAFTTVEITDDNGEVAAIFHATAFRIGNASVGGMPVDSGRPEK